MSNNQVIKDPVPVDGDAEYKEGTLQDPVTNADELGAYENPQIPKGEDDVPGDDVKGDRNSEGKLFSFWFYDKGRSELIIWRLRQAEDLSEVSQGNIIEGTRSTRGQDVTKGYREVDQVVDDALNDNGKFLEKERNCLK